jgi:hypothetical protein
MALSFQLTGAGFPPTALHVESVITMAQQGFDWSMAGIVLTLDAVVPGIDDATFREKANAAKVGCPVSQALSVVPIMLEATLRAYAEGRATRDVAAVATLAQPEATVEARARGLAAAVLKQLAAGVRAEVTVVRAEGQVGGGTLPTATVASWAVRIGGIDATTWERRLRVGDPPVVARIKDGALLLDARTMRDDEVLPGARTVAAAGEGHEMADGEAADDDPE